MEQNRREFLKTDHDVARGVRSRFTFRPGASLASVWSPDGTRVVFNSDNNRSLYRKPANTTGTEELLFQGSVNTIPLDWSGDGKLLVYQMQSGAAGSDLWLLPLDGDRKPVPYLQTPFNEANGQFSPDGRWMAYASNETGQPQIYVQAIPFISEPCPPSFACSNIVALEDRWQSVLSAKGMVMNILVVEQPARQ